MIVNINVSIICYTNNNNLANLNIHHYAQIRKSPNKISAKLNEFTVSDDEYSINKYLTIDMWTPLLEIKKIGSTAEYPEMEQGHVDHVKCTVFG